MSNIEFYTIVTARSVTDLERNVNDSIKFDCLQPFGNVFTVYVGCGENEFIVFHQAMVKYEDETGGK